MFRAFCQLLLKQLDLFAVFARSGDCDFTAALWPTGRFKGESSERHFEHVSSKELHGGPGLVLQWLQFTLKLVPEGLCTRWLCNVKSVALASDIDFFYLSDTPTNINPYRCMQWWKKYPKCICFSLSTVDQPNVSLIVLTNQPLVDVDASDVGD